MPKAAVKDIDELIAGRGHGPIRRRTTTHVTIGASMELVELKEKHVPDQVHLKVEFEIEDDDTELEIELTW